MTQFQSLQNIEDLLMHYAIEGISGSALFWIFSSQAIELSLSTVICRGLMNKIVYMITEELRAAILPIIFFFAVFHLVAITKALILEGYRITPTGALMSQLFCCSVLDHLGVA